MSVEVASHAGFCFGVRNAVETVYSLIEEKSGSKEERTVCTLGPIIHNERVVSDLESRGVVTLRSLDDIPENAIIVIRSHGVGSEVIQLLEQKRVEYVDATCPFVKRIHETVRAQSESGAQIVIIGNASHPEVKGILGWSVTGGTVIENESEAKDFSPKNDRVPICIVSQTTFNSKKFQDLVEIFKKNAYNINVVNTICNATRTRQEEAASLAARSEAMIVVGGKASSNTRKLYEICKQQCENTFFIQTADDLDAINVRSFASLGITAGASTPNTLIQEVLRACQR